MKRTNWMVAVALTSIGCGSNDAAPANVSCGPGTVLVEGTCLPEPPVDAVAEDTTPFDAAIPADAVSVDGTSAADSPPSDGGSAIDATKDGAMDGGSGSDPCPTKVANVNCSSTCPGATVQLNCSRVKCGSSLTSMVVVKDADLPFILRTPEKPGVDPACPTSCSAGGLAYGMHLRVSTLGTTFKLSVGVPWAIYDIGGDPFCPATNHGQCFTATSSYEFLVGTTDANAPVRNVLIQAVPYGSKCL